MTPKSRVAKSDLPSCELKVLVADDSPVYRRLVEQSLMPERYKVLMAKDGRQALDLFAEHSPELVITDWTMPDISGLEVCQAIRLNGEQNHTYVILLTANAEKDEVIEGLAAGADDYLTKPFHPGELLARVRVGRRVVELYNQIRAKNRLLEELALTDSLTSLPNRRAINIWAERQISAAARHHFEMSVIAADLDFFKKVNDTHGHDVGDTVLKGFAEILKLNTRNSDICGRLGGEEFLMAFTHADKQGATLVAERVRKSFEEQKFTANGKIISATASFGIAQFRKAATPALFNEMLGRADAALYSAKHKGRNRVEFADE